MLALKVERVLRQARRLGGQSSIGGPANTRSWFALYELRPTTPLRLGNSGIWFETVVSLPIDTAVRARMVDETVESGNRHSS